MMVHVFLVVDNISKPLWVLAECLHLLTLFHEQFAKCVFDDKFHVGPFPPYNYMVNEFGLRDFGWIL